MLVINALSALRGGGQTYLLNLLRSAVELNIHQEVIIITNTHNKALFSPFESANVRIFEAGFASRNILFRVFWELIVLPFWLAKRKAAVYFAPGGIMVTIMPNGCRSVTALQNMLPFDKKERQRFPLFSYLRFKLWLLRFVYLLSYRLADGVIFISGYSRDVVKGYIPDIENRSVVIYHGSNDEFRRGDQPLPLTLNPDLSPGEFYLYVSILDVYKAQKEAVESWKLLIEKGFKYPLVLVGPSYNEYGREVVDIIENDESGLLRYLGAVDYNLLPTLYQNARALIFSSSCECCPNILIEKLSAGRPVLCSDIQPMPEFGEEAVIYFDPYQIDDLANKVLFLESNEDKFSVYGEKALKQSLLFDWQDTTQKTFDFLKSFEN